MASQDGLLCPKPTVSVSEPSAMFWSEELRVLEPWSNALLSMFLRIVGMRLQVVQECTAGLREAQWSASTALYHVRSHAGLAGNALGRGRLHGPFPFCRSRGVRRTPADVGRVSQSLCVLESVLRRSNAVMSGACLFTSLTLLAVIISEVCFCQPHSQESSRKLMVVGRHGPTKGPGV